MWAGPLIGRWEGPERRRWEGPHVGTRVKKRGRESGCERPHVTVRVVCVVGGSGIRQHTSAYVSIHQHTSEAYLPAARASGEREKGGDKSHTAAYVSIRQHTSAYLGAEREKGEEK